METLKVQEECFNNIKTLCSNYMKDSKSRKTEEYLGIRLQSLERQWLDFERRHVTLLETIEEKSHEYFKGDIFNKTKQLYLKTKVDMDSLLLQLRESKTVQFDLTSTVEETTDEHLKTLLTRQECNFKALDRAMSKVDLKAVTERWELEDHLSILKSKWDAIDKLHWELEAILKGSDITYYTMFVSIEDKYDDLKKNMNARIWSTMHYQKSAPKIEIPEFSGNYSKWISFKDLFLETIHNNPMINKAQKMQHLKTRLRGEAERLVQHLNINAENYNSCWDILSQRYDNRRLQFTSFVNTMLNLPAISQPDSSTLKRLHDVIMECMNGLTNIGLETSTWDPLIVHLMLQKLDATTYTDYMKELQDHRELPHLDQFLFFLESKFMAYEGMKMAKKEIPKLTSASQKSSTNQNYETNYKKNNYEFKKYNTKTLHTTFGQCPHCEKSHVLMQCPRFIDMDTPQRNNLVSKLQLCKNCLYSHGDAECSSTKTCKECKKKHHTMLHNNKATPSTSTSSQQSSNHLANRDLEILLTTVQLKIKSAGGTYVTLRALLDQGSQVNLITEQAAQLLRLPRKRVNATISGVGALSGDCKGRLQLNCMSIHSDYAFETQVLILKKLTNNLPNSSFNTPNWPHLANLKLADPDFNKARPVDLLLGADIYSNVILEGVLKGNKQAPIAQQTQLGWILCGKMQTFNCHTVLVDFNSISKFWEQEDITQDNKDDISKDDQCEKDYLKTVQRASDGKYTVKMPFIPNYEEKIGNSRSIAISQFLQLEKRLERNANLARMYKDFIKEYTELNHMAPAPLLTTKPECYLPHHGVLREHSTTTKLRVVFNASQKTTSGHSLNQLQEKGPNMQKDIQALILKWRSHRYAYTADIEKMYRCIWISDKQQQLQKIIWRNSPSEKLKDYVLRTVTYGMKSAPWLAMRTLKQLAIDDGHKYPDAARTLQDEFYVDDLISGHNTISEAQQLQSSLINLLQGAGMNLRKWSSNDKSLLQNLSKDQISTEQIFDFKHEDTKKTLGLGWNTTNDTFTFYWDLEEKPRQHLTKRHLLSEISKLYDPLGWLAPITVTAKLLFQRVWTSKLAWDETLPTELQQEWFKMKNELHNIKTIKLNRWLGWTHGHIELLCFCDASEKAYSCVIYSRVTNEGLPTITLLAAKTRVAPLAQKITLPRMELCGALLLSQLAQKTIEAFTGHTLTIQAWSDSQVVIAWLQGDSSRWDRYVANRANKIKQVIPAENWHYVKSELNPADCASRGMYATKLLNFDLWWKGPDFIQTFKTQEVPMCLHTTNSELKTTVTALPKTQETHFIDELINKHSSLCHIIRVTAWVRRFSTSVTNCSKPDTNYLTTGELTAANELIIKHVQQLEFEQEYRKLLKKETVSNKSPLYKLNPYLDKKDIIRVGGRLTNSNLPFAMKNPIILSRNGRLTQLLIEQAHSRVLHGGARLTLAYIRQRYWIVGGNRAVKTRLRHCVTCRRHKPTETYQLLSDLPKQRAQPSRPFTHSGVDFTGHVEVKLNKGRGVKTSKGYIAIFVCMATKAVHIELVSDLSTEAFIAAFQRMCARRGTPKHVYSDCGTNFIGAAKVLRKEFEEFKQTLSPEFFTEIGKLEVEWHFNAPAWPSAGGLWEAAVKSLKHHLRRVLGEQKLTYEEFTTLLTKIEACMNSRPLCPLTEDPEEFYNYLTPGHFLTGSPILTLPLSDYSDVKTIDIRRRWQLTENMLQQFWKSWSNEYLTQLQSRSKWNKPMKNIQQGDIVLIKEDNMPPGKWAMGRVIELHPGSDGRVRVTTLKTQTGILKRPVVKLSPLPIETEIPQQQTDERSTKDETSSNEQKEKATASRKTKRTASKTFTTLLLTLFTLATGVHSADNGTSTSAAHITSVESDRPAYYDALGKMQTIHDEWILHHNLPNYWDGIQRVENYLHNLNDLCHKTDPRYCKTTLEQLSHEMELLQHYNSILLTPHQHLGYRKKRRLINGIGSIYSLESKNAPCEAKLLSHSSTIPCDVRKTSCSDAWVGLHSPNTWLAVCCGARTLRTELHYATMTSVLTLRSYTERRATLHPRQ